MFYCVLWNIDCLHIALVSILNISISLFHIGHFQKYLPLLYLTKQDINFHISREQPGLNRRILFYYHSTILPVRNIKQKKMYFGSKIVQNTPLKDLVICWRQSCLGEGRFRRTFPFAAGSCSCSSRRWSATTNDQMFTKT